MEELKVILPITLLVIGFLLKLVVSRHWNDIPNFIQNICELPVDIIFLALSFSVAFAISGLGNHDFGLLYSFVGIGLAIVVLLFRKISMDLFMENKIIWFSFILLLNIIISSISITESVYLIINKESSFSNNTTKNMTEVIDSKNDEIKSIN